ncbi:Hypothetical protein A7982_09269 [Minicystis rosea]|nr:Hypothetical protein A7982_09269 [Minicystis rosea]
MRVDVERLAVCWGMRAWVLVALMLCGSTACGSTAISEVTGGTTSGSGGAAASSGSGASGGGNACTPWNGSGEACTASEPMTMVQCVTPKAICSCGGGALDCYDSETFTKLDFQGPTAPPPDGACCDTEGMTCGGYSDCGPLCHCTGGTWSCATPAACPPFTCPTTSNALFALQDAACPKEHIGLLCSVGEGCGYLGCTCTLKPETGDAAWRCIAAPC